METAPRPHFKQKFDDGLRSWSELLQRMHSQQSVAAVIGKSSRPLLSSI
jgi:hypothetical protein